MPGKALVFGGSFDPPHIGHMNLLRQAMAAAAPDEVLIIPSGTAPHKRESKTPWDVRAAMCECFRAVAPQLVISDIEEKRSGKSYTCDTLATLKEQAPGRELYLCIGGDMLESFATWHRWQDILRLATLVVAGRGEAPQETLAQSAQTLRENGGRILFTAGAEVPASSSRIRQMVAEGRDVAALVPPPVYKIIQERQLYQSE